MKKIKIVIALIPLLVLVLFGLTYVPHNPFHISTAKISKIHILNGSTGYEVDITEESEKKQFISSIKGTYQKGKLAYGHMGYGYRVKIYNQKGAIVKEFYINYGDTVRLNGFFFRAKGHSIDYDFLETRFNQ